MRPESWEDERNICSSANILYEVSHHKSCRLYVLQENTSLCTRPLSNIFIRQTLLSLLHLCLKSIYHLFFCVQYCLYSLIRHQWLHATVQYPRMHKTHSTVERTLGKLAAHHEETLKTEINSRGSWRSMLHPTYLFLFLLPSPTNHPLKTQTRPKYRGHCKTLSF